MSSYILLAVLSIGSINGRASAQTTSGRSKAGQSTGVPTPTAADLPSWLFPVAKLNERLPYWLRFGGQYRGRLEGPIGINFTGTNDFYLLDRLRVWVNIQPKDWLRFHAEVQDARIFFNHHIPNANPYQDTWTLWRAYAQIGSSTEGWLDALGGRQVLEFGDERVIGPSTWTNVGRTFNVARINIHHSDNKVSVFASSVVPENNTALHSAIPGNNLYGVYGSLKTFIPKATFEPYVLWRGAPANPTFTEEVGHGHLDEFTFGLRVEGNPKSSGTTPNLMGRQVPSAHSPYGHGRGMPMSIKRFPRLRCRHVFLSRETTPRERRIRRDLTGILLTRSILPTTTNTVSPIRSAAGT